MDGFDGVYWKYEDTLSTDSFVWHQQDLSVGIIILSVAFPINSQFDGTQWTIQKEKMCKNYI